MPVMPGESPSPLLSNALTGTWLTCCQVVPPLVVTNKPFSGVPTYTMLGLLGSTAIFCPYWAKLSFGFAET